MYPLFKQPYRLYVLFGYGGILIPVLMLVDFTVREIKLLEMPGVGTDNFPLGILRVALVGMLIYLTLLILAAIPISQYSLKKYGKLVEATLHQCQVDLFVCEHERFELMIKKHPKRFNHVIRQKILHNLGAGYFAQGEFELASALLQKKPKWKEKGEKRLLTLYYLLNNCQLFIAKKDLLRAEEFFTDAELFLERHKDLVLHRQVVDFYAVTKASFCITKGELEGIEDILNVHLKNARHLYHEVQCQLLLSKIYLKEERKSEARKALAFVIENGGDSYFAREAEYMLKGV